MVLCRRRGKQLQDTFARFLHQFSRFVVCQPADTVLAYSAQTDTTDLLAGLPHLGLQSRKQFTHLGCPVAFRQVS